jgi:hypothetical protein
MEPEDVKCIAMCVDTNAKLNVGYFEVWTTWETDRGHVFKRKVILPLIDTDYPEVHSPPHFMMFANKTLHAIYPEEVPLLSYMRDPSGVIRKTCQKALDLWGENGEGFANLIGKEVGCTVPGRGCILLYPLDAMNQKVEQSTKCSCPLDVLMNSGCQCKGV